MSFGFVGSGCRKLKLGIRHLRYGLKNSGSSLEVCGYGVSALGLAYRLQQRAARFGMAKPEPPAKRMQCEMLLGFVISFFAP